MCQTLNFIHLKKSKNDLTNADISKHMTAKGTQVSGDMVQKYFSGGAGVPIENLGPFLSALGLKVVDSKNPDVDAEEFKALKMFAGKYLNESESSE